MALQTYKMQNTIKVFNEPFMSSDIFPIFFCFKENYSLNLSGALYWLMEQALGYYQALYNPQRYPKVSLMGEKSFYAWTIEICETTMEGGFFAVGAP